MTVGAVSKYLRKTFKFKTNNSVGRMGTIITRKRKENKKGLCCRRRPKMDKISEKRKRKRFRKEKGKKERINPNTHDADFHSPNVGIQPRKGNPSA